MRVDYSLSHAAVATLVAAPTFALRRLDLTACNLDAAALLALANAPWPLEELDLHYNNDFSVDAAGPALAAPSRHTGLRILKMGGTRLSAAGFKALDEAAWPALAVLKANFAEVAFDGLYALGAAAFAGFPALEELELSGWRWVRRACGCWRAGARRASGGWTSANFPCPSPRRSRAWSGQRSSSSACRTRGTSALASSSRTRAAGRPRWRS
jgi:hypothetical protein